MLGKVPGAYYTAAISANPAAHKLNAVITIEVYGGAFVFVLVFRWFWPMPIFSHSVALWPSLALVVLAVGIAAWGIRTMQAAGTNVNPALRTTAIVASGPFRFSRNPLYLALTLLYLGLTLAFNTWWALSCWSRSLSSCIAELSCARSATLSKNLVRPIGSIVPRFEGIFKQG